VCRVSGDVSDGEPSDAETIDSESSGDEVLSVSSDDVSDSETEQITRSDNVAIVPNSVKKENISTEAVSADRESEVMVIKAEGMVRPRHSSLIPLREIKPTDTAVIDYESLEDESDSIDDVLLVSSDPCYGRGASEIEPPTETGDVAAMPKALNAENFSSEAASADEVQNSDTCSADSGVSCHTEHSRKVRVLPVSRQPARRRNFSTATLCANEVPNSATNTRFTGAKFTTKSSHKVGLPLEPQAARRSKPAVTQVLESYAISAQRGSIERSDASFAVPQTSLVTGGSTSISDDAAVIKVLESYAVSAQQATIERSGTSFESAVTDGSTTLPDGATTGICSQGSSLKPSDVSLTAEFDRSVLGRSQLRASTTSTACSVRSQRVVPTLCESVGKSTLFTQEPPQAARSSRPAIIELLESYAVSAQQANGERSGASFEDDCFTTFSDGATMRSCSGGSSLKPSAVSLTAGLGRFVSIGAQPVEHSLAQNGSTAPRTCLVKSRRILPTLCENAGTSASLTEGPLDEVSSESVEKLMDRTFALPQASDNVSVLSSLSSVDRHHHLTFTKAGAGPSTSKTFTVTDVSKHHRSIDVKPSLGKSVVIADLAPSISDKKQRFGAVTPTGQWELASALNKPLHRLSSDSPWVDEVRFARQLATSRLACTRQQVATTKKSGSALVQGPAVTGSTVSADVNDQPALGNHLDHRKISCSKDNATHSAAASESLLSEVSAVAKVVKRSRLPRCCTTVTKEQVITGGAEADPLSPLLPQVPVSMKVVRNGHISDSWEETGQCTVVASNQFKVSDGKDSQSSSVGFDCIDSNNNNDREDQNLSDLDLAGMRTDDAGAVQKSLPRRFRGFAVSTPLPDCSPPRPPDASFGSLSSISLASDWEDIDAADDTDYNVEPEDKNSVTVPDDSVILLDVAFAEGSSPNSPQSTTTPSPVTLEPLQSSSHGTSAGTRRNFRRRYFQPATDTNFATTGFLNPRGRGKTRGSERTNDLGSVVRSVVNKRTHVDVSSSSSSSDDDRSSVWRNSRSARNIRVRRSPTAEISSCAGRSHCTKAICFRCRCD